MTLVTGTNRDDGPRWGNAIHAQLGEQGTETLGWGDCAKQARARERESESKRRRESEEYASIQRFPKCVR